MGHVAEWLPTIVLAAGLVFWGYCVMDFVRTDTSEIRSLTRQTWLVVLLLGSVAGATAWYLLGRPRDAPARRTRTTPTLARRRRRPHTAPMTIEQWWDAGDRVTLTFGGAARQVFVRRIGTGSPMTLLHGFPSSSHDWAKVAGDLAASYALLMPDFLGFGASDKPRGHAYSIGEQADLVEALWAAEGVTSTRLVAHDYAVSVAQELLCRRAAGDLRVELERVDFLNGGIYPDLHRPEPVQTALLDPEEGPAVSAMIDAGLIAAALVPTFSPGYDLAQDAADIWASMARSDGQLNAHLLIRYITDRQQNAERWTSVLETTDVPLHFCWGMLDPISGAHMAERLRERLPDAPFTALEDVAHWPPLEAPDRVAAAILA